MFAFEKKKEKPELWRFWYILIDEDYSKNSMHEPTTVIKYRFSQKRKLKDGETQHCEGMGGGVCSVSSAKAFY